MSTDATSNLALPFILPSQAQKHVTHNEALQRLDLVTQLTISANQATAPENPADGEVYAIGANATGIWEGKDGWLAAWQDGAWVYLAPKAGWRAYVRQEDACLYFDGETWQALPLPETATFQNLGIAATADEINRLAVSSPASLFNHAGASHRLSVNKAETSATASLVFQSAWTGRAEMGLAGEDSFSIKVNGEATGWRTAISVSPEGYVRHDQRPHARASLATATLTVASGSFSGFDQLHLAGGGMAFGSVVAAGRGSTLRIPASGLYMVTLSVSTPATTLQTVHLSLNATTDLLGHSGTAGGSSSSAIVWLEMGNHLSLRHASAGQIAFGYGKTEICVAML
ncbi:DUF2793 domain-containing protein [Peteryoungia ipomoeae]|uniref:DUF2793 domain-containing protein n=1 Tax=Peteryoungia ipomoeae TaxID=1210932 RepID=A0A4S8NYL7_9HYPH|nr:DUF2793 domain-containing protein [Peteryoungia ipomoeae]THV21412.1 DUF2793 domain-containing protein [Peteryoungia ipomoeae]